MELKRGSSLLLLPAGVPVAPAKIAWNSDKLAISSAGLADGRTRFCGIVLNWRLRSRYRPAVPI